MTPSIEKSSGGLRSAAIPMADRGSVAFGVWVSVGGRHETPEQSGISHFLEHIVFKGTQRRSALQIKEAVEGVGGSLNAFTAEEHTCFLARVSSKHFSDVFGVISDMVLDASIRKEDVDKERGVILEEIKMTEDQPSQLADEMLSQILWPGHALGRPLAGTRESVGGLSEKNLKDHRDRHYRAQNITVIAAGGIEPAAFHKEAGRIFGGSARSAPAESGAPFRGEAASARVLARAKPTEQTHLSLAVHGPEKGHRLEPATDVLSVVLGGNMSSRLFNEVREERGLAYDIASYVRKYQETGAFIVSAGVDHAKLPDALSVILSELRKIAKEPVGSAELGRAKEFYLGQLELSLENTMNQMLFAGESLLSFDRIKPFDEVAAEITAVTPDHLREAAAGLFERPFYLSVVGPDPREDRLARILS